jgi:hypothetical protein
MGLKQMEHQKMNRNGLTCGIAGLMLAACSMADPAAEAANVQAAKAQAEATRIDGIVKAEAQERGLTRLSGQELRTLLPGRGLYWREYILQIRFQFYRDGRWLSESGGGVAPVTWYGKYSLLDDRLCVQASYGFSYKVRIKPDIDECYLIFRDNSAGKYIFRIKPFDQGLTIIPIEIKDL